MKKSFAAGLVALILGSGAAMAEPVAGTWRTEPGDTGGYLLVRLAPCGGAVCGTIAQAMDRTGAPVSGYEHAGRKMLWNMTPKGGGAYRGGKIWAPDRDKTYTARMQQSGDRLVVEGCVLGICRGQTWARVK